jgi:hypothetical protein
MTSDKPNKSNKSSAIKQIQVSIVRKKMHAN